MNVTVLPDPDAVAEHAAQCIVQAAEESIVARGVFTLALAGGSTPEKLYARLVNAPIDWHCVHLYLGDERFVPHDHPASNVGMARRTLIEHIPIPPQNCHPIPTDCATADEAAQRYEAMLPDALDLVLLGLGEDGHTASLFPGKPALAVTDRRVVASLPGVLPPPVERVTLTLPALNAARSLLFLITGAKKREKWAQWRRNEGTVEELPVLGLSLEKVIVLVDREAA